ncbi:MAG: hypothetical protein AVO38_13300 [delta proteobacterium ML8_D]|jgi:pimeloyl-ACP methyl ester carboxylesterase|nr:MAG: hypothetical protein AVO38_13300 [delta proteobacterium ML8_D]
MKKTLFCVLILFFLFVNVNKRAAAETGCDATRNGECTCSPQHILPIGLANNKVLLELNQPVVDIKANYSNDSLMVLPEDKVSISLSLDPGSYAGQEADWWIVADTPYGLFSYVHPDWREDLHYCIQAHLNGFSDFPILNSPLPQGSYTFYFAIDNNADGIADVTWMDSIKVHVVPPLKTADDSAVTDRTPLILVHGNNSESKSYYRWGDYLKKSEQDTEFLDNFKIYLFQWDSNQSNKFNAAALGTCIDGMKVLNDKKLMILAHSRGGLVSRYFMNDHITEKGIYSGQPAGERTDYLITLGTPHRGTPGADPYWCIFSFDYNYSSFLAEQLSLFYLNYIYEPSYNNLLWDDFENELTEVPVCWYPSILNSDTEFCSTLQSAQSDLDELNSEDSYLDKIVAFGGNEFNEEPFQWGFGWHEHKALSAFSILLAEIPVIPTDYPEIPIDDQYRPFQANDGMVPLTSALFLKSGPQKLFTFQDGQLIYDPQKLNSQCQLKRCIVIENRQTDHLDFLDDEEIIDLVISTIKNIK